MADGVIIALTMLIAGIVHTVAGFGSALVSMPILSWVVGVQTATPLQAVLALPISAQVFLRNRKSFAWHEAWPMIVASLIGIPMGAYILVNVPEAIVAGGLGLILIAFTAFETFVMPRRPPKTDAPDGGGNGWFGKCLAGLCSGVLGGAYATNGPPLIMYGVWRRWDREVFRSVLQSVFLVNGAGVIVWHSVAGIITRDVFYFALFGAPGMIIGVLAGNRIDRLLPPAGFRKFLLALVTLLGLSLLFKAFSA